MHTETMEGLAVHWKPNNFGLANEPLAERPGPGPNIAFSNASDAAFRTWVAAVKSALSAIGLTQTADTGQIDTATVLTPSAASQNRGSAVYTPNDGSTDYYLVFGFGSSSAGALSPQIYLTIGWATDGASNLVGAQQSVQFRFYTNNANSGSTFDLYSCKSGSAIAMSINEAAAGSTPNRSWWAVDRDRNQSTGAALTTGVTVWNAGTVGVIGNAVNSITNTQRVPAAAGTGPLIVNNLPSIFPRTAASWGRGGTVGVGAIIPWDGGMYPQTIACHGVSATDFVIGDNAIAVSVYGTSYNYRATGASTGGQNTGSRGIIIWQ